MAGEHPSPTELAGAAAGDPELRRRLAPHLAFCAVCTAELARLLGVLEVGVEEVIARRPGCPPPEDLAEVAAGTAGEDPHTGTCPLCQAELEVLRGLEVSQRVAAAFEGGAPHRVEATRNAALPLAAAAPGRRVAVALREGVVLHAVVSGAPVQLQVSGGELHVDVAREPDHPCELVLENEFLQRRLPLRAGRTLVPVGTWTAAAVRPIRGQAE